MAVLHRGTRFVSLSAVILLLVAAPSYAAVIQGVPGGVLWLQADSLSLSDGQTVNTWTNSVSGAGTAGNAVLDNSDPAFVANAIGGMPAVAFDDGDTGSGPTTANGDSMKVNSFQSSFVDNKKFTTFMVTIADNTVFGPTPTSISGSVNRFYPRREALTYQTSSSVREDLSIASQAGAAEITVFQHTGSQIEAWLNGISQGTAAIGLGNIGGDQPLYLSWWPGNTPQTGQLAELIWFTESLSRPEINSIGTYLGGKYGINFVVPEPSTLLVWALLAGIGAASGRRRRNRAR